MRYKALIVPAHELSKGVHQAHSPVSHCHHAANSSRQRVSKTLKGYQALRVLRLVLLFPVTT